MLAYEFLAELGDEVPDGRVLGAVVRDDDGRTAFSGHLRQSVFPAQLEDGGDAFVRDGLSRELDWVPEVVDQVLPYEGFQRQVYDDILHVTLGFRVQK